MQNKLREEWQNTCAQENDQYGNSSGTSSTLAVLKENELVVSHLEETAVFLVNNPESFERLTPDHSTSNENELNRAMAYSEDLIEEKVMTNYGRVFREKMVVWDTTKCPITVKLRGTQRIHRGELITRSTWECACNRSSCSVPRRLQILRITTFRITVSLYPSYQILNR